MSDIEVYLDAYGDHRRVGLLRRHPGRGRERLTYEHDEEWRTSARAFEFDPTLPLNRGPISPPRGREMFGTLGDSAPDTWGRKLMDRRERRRAAEEGRRPRALSEADYLIGVSDRTRSGALRFCVNGEYQAPQTIGVPGLVALGDLLRAAEHIERGEETDEDLILIFAPGSSLGGARPKASVYDQHNNLSIAKFPKETDSYSIERWEAIAMDMAKDAGIRVSDYRLEEAGGRPVFLSRRFDRIGTGKDAQRIPFISAMAMTDHQDGDDDCSYLEIADVLAERGAHADRDREEMFRRIAFTILVSNTDDHFRNHGFLWEPSGGWALSPLYDVNPNPIPRGFLTTMINFDEATASLALLREVSEFFLPSEDAEAVIQECAAVTRRWKEFANARNAPRSEITHMEPAFENEALEEVS